MANIDNVQLPDGSSYNIVDNTSGFASQSYVDSAVSSITKTTIGLGNVDNTSDLNKPISTATQVALDTLDEDKADKTDIATVESGTTASRAYSVGELVYVSGTLYRVKTAIARGATFTIGTNVEVTNVSNAIPPNFIEDGTIQTLNASITIGAPYCNKVGKCVVVSIIFSSSATITSGAIFQLPWMPYTRINPTVIGKNSNVVMYTEGNRVLINVGQIEGTGNYDYTLNFSYFTND